MTIRTARVRDTTVSHRPGRTRAPIVRAAVTATTAAIAPTCSTVSNVRLEPTTRWHLPRYAVDLRACTGGDSYEQPARAGAGRRNRRRHRRQQHGLPPGPTRLEGHRADRQRPDAQPRWIDRARLELHLSHRSLEGDDALNPRQRPPVQGTGGVHPERWHRGG